MARSTSAIAGQAAYNWGGAALFAAAAVIMMALGFEYLGGYEPCQLCLQQRYAYYVGIPVLFIALMLIGLELHKAATVLFFLIGMAFLANAGFGVYHAGVEWNFWDGPATCDAGALKPLATGGKGVLNSLSEPPSGPSCGVATWRLLGLSFAGWNAVVCVALTIACIKAAFASSEANAAG